MKSEEEVFGVRVSSSVYMSMSLTNHCLVDLPYHFSKTYERYRLRSPYALDYIDSVELEERRPRSGNGPRRKRLNFVRSRPFDYRPDSDDSTMSASRSPYPEYDQGYKIPDQNSHGPDFPSPLSYSSYSSNPGNPYPPSQRQHGVDSMSPAHRPPPQDPPGHRYYTSLYDPPLIDPGYMDDSRYRDSEKHPRR